QPRHASIASTRHHYQLPFSPTPPPAPRCGRRLQSPVFRLTATPAIARLFDGRSSIPASGGNPRVLEAIGSADLGSPAVEHFGFLAMHRPAAVAVLEVEDGQRIRRRARRIR